MNKNERIARLKKLYFPSIIVDNFSKPPSPLHIWCGGVHSPDDVVGWGKWDSLENMNKSGSYSLRIGLLSCKLFDDITDSELDELEQLWENHKAFKAKHFTPPKKSE